jgi:predicted dehydrogenase
VVLLSFGNESKFDVEPVLRAALAVDPQRVFIPISGGELKTMPADLRSKVIDDSHPYHGWYDQISPQTWTQCKLVKSPRMVTISEFGAEALDSYETMLRYPPQLRPPPADADTLWAASQVEKHDVRQITGLGRNPTNLLEYIEASQNFQEAHLADKITGMRLSAQAISGYFHFHFLDVVPAFWPKSIVSFDHRPKKAYFQLAQLNQPIVALPQLSGTFPDAMTLWIANDLDEAFPKATVRWSVSNAGRTLLEGRQHIDVPPVTAVAGERIDLLSVVKQYSAFEVKLALSDSKGRLLSRYQRTVRVVPQELPKAGLTTSTTDPFNDAKDGSVKWMTLDPGHFHAALVQKSMYPQIDPVVHVYSPGGADMDAHLARIEQYNTRTNTPTHWVEKSYAGPDFLERMLKEKPGNVVVLSGNNSRKAQYIARCIEAGLNVLSDKPMAITPGDFDLIQEAFKIAAKKGVLLSDIMPERYEITTILQRELSRRPEVFGELERGTSKQPAIEVANVHHFFKSVSGVPLQRPPWFFDVKQQGEGIVDVTTHLVDLVQWEAFPEQDLKPSDVKMLSARRWATRITPAEFKRVTGQDSYPPYLQPAVGKDDILEVFSNGEFQYTLRGVNAKVAVTWNYEPAPGGTDTHYSILRGTKADLTIRQGREQDFQATLYVKNKAGQSKVQFKAALAAGLDRLKSAYPGLRLKETAGEWEVMVPDKYKVGHEAHFAQVTENYLRFLAQGRMPAGEVSGMITKYFTTMEAYKLSR